MVGQQPMEVMPSLLASFRGRQTSSPAPVVPTQTTSPLLFHVTPAFTYCFGGEMFMSLAYLLYDQKP